MRHQNPDKFQFKFSTILYNTILYNSVRDYCWRPRKSDASSKQSYSQNAMLKSNAEYNRRAAIIEGLRAGRSATEIIRFFGYPRLTVYDVVAKYIWL